MPTGVMRRVLAVAEVLAAFAAMHVAFRAFQRFTEWGRADVAAGMNFSPGAAMVMVAVAALLLHRRRPREYGFSSAPVRENLNTGVVSLVLLAACGAALIPWLDRLGPRALTASWAIGLALTSLGFTALLLWVLVRLRPVITRAPASAPLVLLAGLAVLPAAWALAQHRGPWQELLTTAWVLLGAGLGEELFFRGYVQSRLNEAFGRPWRLVGVAFGPGLLIAAAMFGLVHVLNTTDYFAGTYHFRWRHGLTSGATLYFGFLRERTGGVLAPAIVHGYSDLLMRLPRLLAGA